jgi:hypothetical protein
MRDIIFLKGPWFTGFNGQSTETKNCFLTRRYSIQKDGSIQVIQLSKSLSNSIPISSAFQPLIMVGAYALVLRPPNAAFSSKLPVWHGRVRSAKRLTLMEGRFPCRGTNTLKARMWPQSLSSSNSSLARRRKLTCCSRVGQMTLNDISNLLRR